MAIDTIYASRDVSVLAKERGRRSLWLESLQIRVGIHIGEVVAGVLGEKLPKFTLFGLWSNVNTKLLEWNRQANQTRYEYRKHSIL